MSNIHGPDAHLGLDDEELRGPFAAASNPQSKCRPCWSQAKTTYFAQPFHRRGETLEKTYRALHAAAHQNHP